MKLQHVRAMARKEWWHLLRDARSLAMMLLMPTMLLFLFGYAIRLDIVDAPLGLLQESEDGASNAIASRFDASHAFEIVQRYRSRDELEHAVRRGEIWAGLVIPREYARDLERGEARLQLILDGVDANSARLVRNYALALLNDYALREGVSDLPLRIVDRTWFNEAKESRMAILPGVIALVMAVIGALMTSLTVAREMELGNLVMLRTTSLSRSEFLVGKLTPYFVIGMVDLFVAVAVAVYAFDVPVRGSLPGLTVFSAIFLLCVMLQGALISIIAGNQLLASQMAMVSTFLPSFLLSGFVFAIENMPLALQYLTNILPARYYVELSRIIFLKGVSPLLLWTQGAALLAIMTVLSLLAVRRASALGLLR